MSGVVKCPECGETATMIGEPIIEEVELFPGGYLVATFGRQAVVHRCGEQKRQREISEALRRMEGRDESQDHDVPRG